MPKYVPDTATQLGNVLAVWAADQLGIERSVLPRRVSEAMRGWDAEMLETCARSAGQRFHIDQACSLREPPSLQPRVETAPEYRLSEDQIRSFYRNGYLGPFPLIGADELEGIRARIKRAQREPSRVYGIVTDRDHHLEDPGLRELFARPAAVERCAQLLGPDLLLWRSQIFDKPPGSPAVDWHQASTYFVDNRRHAVLVPEDRNELFQLTVWIAIDRADSGNGGLRIVRGSHDSIKTVSAGGESQFYAAGYTLHYPIEPERVQELDVGPGEFLIFTERAVHGSSANRSERSRMAINYRVVPTSVAIYPEMPAHWSIHMQEKYDLAKWGAVLLRGNDRHQRNRIARGYV